MLLSEEGKVLVVTLWSSDEAARATLLSGFYQAQIEKIVDRVFRAPPGREAYEVVVAEAPVTARVMAMSKLFGIPVGSLASVLGGGFAAALAVVVVLALRNRVFFRLGRPEREPAAGAAPR